MECLRCRKELFLSSQLARNAAAIYNWRYGKEYTLYECPYRAGDYHLTTKRWRAKKRSTKASKSTACDQGRQ